MHMDNVCTVHVRTCTCTYRAALRCAARAVITAHRERTTVVMGGGQRCM